LGELASHLADIVNWTQTIATTDEMVFDPAEFKPKIYGSAQELVSVFDAGVKAAEAALATIPDDKMFVPWSLKTPTETIFTLPRVATLRTMVLSHLVHHRGQLTVYLRLKDVPLPSVYGPSADEQS